MKPRLVAYVDMDAFFAALEQRDNPALCGKPVIVCGSGPRTVVSAASYEARAFGVKSAMPLFQAQRLCPHAFVVEADIDKYAAAARELYSVLYSFSPVVEIVSIDEACLELSPPPPRPVQLGLELKAAVQRALHVTCSVGLAHNKLLAKLASDFDKPDGLVWVRPQAVEHFLDQLPVEALPGVGPRTLETLHGLHVTTVKALRALPLDTLRLLFGESHAAELYRKARGEDDSPLVPFTEVPPPKSLSSDFTLPRDTADKRLLEYHLFRLAEELALRLARERLAARGVAVSLRFARFQVRRKYRKVTDFLVDGYDIFQVARELLQRFYPLPEPVRRVGVKLSHLCEAVYQPSLFEDAQRKLRLQETLAQIRKKFGDDALVRARLTRPPEER